MSRGLARLVSRGRSRAARREAADSATVNAGAPERRVVPTRGGLAVVGWDPDWGAYTVVPLDDGGGDTAEPQDAATLHELAEILGGPIPADLADALDHDAKMFPGPRVQAHPVYDPATVSEPSPPPGEPEMDWQGLVEPDRESMPPDVDPALLDGPTVGAILRQRGVDTSAHHADRAFSGMSPEAKHLLAVTLVTEAQRRALLDKLDAIAGFLWTGATPDQAVAEVVDLVDTYHGRGSRLSRGELARTPPGAQFAAARPDTLAADVEARLGRRPANPSASTALVALDALLASDRTTRPPSQDMGVA